MFYFRKKKYIRIITLSVCLEGNRKFFKGQDNDQQERRDDTIEHHDKEDLIPLILNEIN